jgi:hypothetical protein
MQYSLSLDASVSRSVAARAKPGAKAAHATSKIGYFIFIFPSLVKTNK